MAYGLPTGPFGLKGVMVLFYWSPPYPSTMILVFHNPPSAKGSGLLPISASEAWRGIPACGVFLLPATKV